MVVAQRSGVLMTFAIYAMIYAGSALMVYNIARCYGFVKKMKALKSLGGGSALLYVPLALLVSFLLGYLGVAFFGEPDLIIGGILFGGSVFVWIVLGIMYRIIDRLSEANSRSEAMYSEIKGSLESLARGYLSVFRVNLTTDAIEDRAGMALTDSDLEAKTYTELLERRRGRMLTDADSLPGGGSFTRKELLRRFEAGFSTAEEELFCCLPSGEVCFVKVKAALAAHPETGDVVAFITEEPYNDKKVNEVLSDKALSQQFDMITYLVGGRYGVVIGDPDARKQGSVFPLSREGDYAQYLREQVAPVLCGDDAERAQLLDALSMDGIVKALDQHEPYEVNVAVAVDGETFYKRFVFYVVDRQVGFYLLLKSDTTELRRAEIERSERLSAALEEAQRASKAKTTFLSNMSHDIRTPMNAIVGYTEFARKSDDLNQVHDYLEKIDASSKYLLALINDVLEMSRIESGKLELFDEDTDLGEVMGAVRDMFETQMREKGIDYAVDASRMNCGLVRCDRSRLNRVLLNLISNAYKFTPQGGRVEVRLVQLDSAPEGFGSYELHVKDTGMGMSPEFAQRVFDAFERERNSTASGIQGTGLGMAITKRIVDAMGGDIEVITEQGRGTEFVVRLQFQLQEEGCDEPGAAGAQALSADSINFKGMRILLVEDNEINREIATIVLEEAGFSVEEAVDGKQAVDMLVAAGPGHFDVVVTDIQMPVMDGYEEARAIRALDDPQLAGIPIIAMSANAFQEDVQASKEAGMNGHVAKPINVDAVMDALAAVLGEK